MNNNKKNNRTTIISLKILNLGGVAFGAITNQTPNFQQFFYIDGVMGLGCSYSFGKRSTLRSVTWGKKNEKIRMRI